MEWHATTDLPPVGLEVMGWAPPSDDPWAVILWEAGDDLDSPGPPQPLLQRCHLEQRPCIEPSIIAIVWAPSAPTFWRYLVPTDD